MFGSVDLGATSFVTTTRTFGGAGSNASELFWDSTTFALTITLGAGATTGIGPVSSTATYTPAAAIVDATGVAISGTAGHTGFRF